MSFHFTVNGPAKQNGAFVNRVFSLYSAAVHQHLGGPEIHLHLGIRVKLPVGNEDSIEPLPNWR